MENRKTRTNSKSRIIDAAFENFVAHGYEGASLSAIAEAVGIRKASIYTHFESKDVLFDVLFLNALEAESLFVVQCFDAHIDNVLPGEVYCQKLQARYLENIHLRFLIRMAYVPPQHFSAMISSGYIGYIQLLTEKLRLAFAQFNLSHEQLELYCDAYLGVVDSLCVELLYGEQLYDRRYKAMFMMYKNILDKHSI